MYSILVTCIVIAITIALAIYSIIGIIAGNIFNSKYKWKVDFKISPEKFGACWSFYVPKLISELNAIKKQSSRNMVIDTLDDIGYDKTAIDKKSNF